MDTCFPVQNTQVFVEDFTKDDYAAEKDGKKVSLRRGCPVRDRKNPPERKLSGGIHYTVLVHSVMSMPGTSHTS